MGERVAGFVQPSLVVSETRVDSVRRRRGRGGEGKGVPESDGKRGRRSFCGSQFWNGAPGVSPVDFELVFE